MMPLLNSATLTQLPRRFGGRRRLTDLLMLQDWPPQKIAHRDLLAKERLKEPQTEQPITHLGLPMRKILAYYRLYSAPKARGIWHHEEDA